jgi:hypothetical protein
MGEGKLRRLCHFASERAVAAQDLNDAFCGQFLSHLEHTTLPNPRTVDREARKLLNRTCETVPGLPGRPVGAELRRPLGASAGRVPSNSLGRARCLLSMRTAKAKVAVDDLLSEEELFGGEGEGPIEAKTIRESTADLIRYRVRQFRSALVYTKVMRPEEIVRSRRSSPRRWSTPV